MWLLWPSLIMTPFFAVESISSIVNWLVGLGRSGSCEKAQSTLPLLMGGLVASPTRKCVSFAPCARHCAMRMAFGSASKWIFLPGKCLETSPTEPMNTRTLSSFEICGTLIWRAGLMDCLNKCGWGLAGGLLRSLTQIRALSQVFSRTSFITEQVTVEGRASFFRIPGMQERVTLERVERAFAFLGFYCLQNQLQNQCDWKSLSISSPTLRMRWNALRKSCSISSIVSSTECIRSS